jgi:hypothetical protein
VYFGLIFWGLAPFEMGWVQKTRADYIRSRPKIKAQGGSIRRNYKLRELLDLEFFKINIFVKYIKCQDLVVIK